MATKRITLSQLRKLKACKDQLDLFKSTFGASAAVTEANLVRAVAAGLNIDWLAGKTLPAPARKAYNEALASAREAYHEAIAPAREAYDEAVASAWMRAYLEVNP